MEILGGRVSIQNVIIRNGGNGDLEGPGGAIFNLGTLELQGTIIAQSYTNQAGGGIYNEGNLYLYMSTVSNNSARSCGGIFNTGTLDIVFTTPTRTHALLAGSPAIDAAPYTECRATDQRGVERPLDGNGDLRAVCDIGAFEYDTVPSAPPPPIATSPPSPPTPTSAPTSCRTNIGSWQNTRLGSLTGTFTGTFDATPHQPTWME